MYDLLINGFNWPNWALVLIFVVSVWDLVWKLLSMWKAALKKSPVWFVVLMVFNTAGILPILYYYIFSNWKDKKWKKKKTKKKK